MRPAASAPLTLPGQISRRAVWLVVGALLLLWGVSLLSMRADVDDELEGARSMALLAERLNTLGQMSESQALLALQAWRAEASLRHLRVRVSDVQGAVLLDASPQTELSPPLQWLVQTASWLLPEQAPFTVAWTLAREAGPAWTVTLSAAPESERAEALRALSRAALFMAALALGMWVVMRWSTERAFWPLVGLLAAMEGLEHRGRGQVSAVQQLPTMPIAELERLAAGLRHLDAALVEAEQGRQRLTEQLLSLQEDERQRLARELHDELGQRLTALRLGLRWLQRGAPDAATQQKVAQQLDDDCAAMAQAVRQILQRLHPVPGGDGQGERLPWSEVAGLLASLVEAWQVQPGQPLQASWQGAWRDASGALQPWSEPAGAVSLSRPVALLLYRITQEALTNVARHAQAKQVQLSWTMTPEASGGWALEWSVQDDGVGLGDPAAALRRGSGLAGLQERLWAHGTTLQVAPAQPGALRPGTRLSARVRWT